MIDVNQHICKTNDKEHNLRSMLLSLFDNFTGFNFVKAYDAAIIWKSSFNLRNSCSSIDIGILLFLLISFDHLFNRLTYQKYKIVFFSSLSLENKK